MKMELQGILEKVQKVQQDMEAARQKVNAMTVSADSGGGMVTVVMNGANQVQSIKISKEVVNPEDVEMLEDLVVAATNKAVKAAQDMVSEEMGKVTPMLPNIPGLNLGM
ncbi:MAG: YbaB/EbfC family nucleoid-associated protein [Ignavibacteriae bacterium]|nr:YbaB/EbfC family nucleoid-associated protein [Ignavibacteriota bacterium]